MPPPICELGSTHSLPEVPVILPKIVPGCVMVTAASVTFWLTRTEPAANPPPQQPENIKFPSPFPVSGFRAVNFGDLALG